MSTSVFQSLHDISKSYKIFEKDQVLTEDQLNGLMNYLDDQDRLTRVSLVGVGILGGLHAILADDGIRLTKGVGITTDGDLLRVPADLLYSHFRPYDEHAPEYAPFYVDGVRQPLLEMVDAGMPGATGLDAFPATTGRKLGEMAAILLMESSIRDGDLCTGGDCDNKGQDSENNVRLLLIDSQAAGRLLGALPTCDAAARDLDFVFANRVRLNDTLNTPGALAAAIRSACVGTVLRLKSAFNKIHPACSALLPDALVTDPAPRWNARLDAGETDAGISCFYDFLKDLTETYNDFRESLFGDTTVLCPPQAAFPKHLVLGSLAPVDLPPSNRTGFYPASASSSSASIRTRASFLLRKLDALVTSYRAAVDPAADPQITPSHGEDRPLEERAIPRYYNVRNPSPLPEAWNYRLAGRSMANYNYSANADDYDGKGGASDPLAFQIARFGFFRVEGHLGQKATRAMELLEQKIAANNLPFLVRAVLVGTDRPKIAIKPPIRYTDLHRIHYVVRQDITRQLEDVVEHNQILGKSLDDAVAGNVLRDDRKDDGAQTLRERATQQQQELTASVAKAKTKLSQNYLAYRVAGSWQNDVRETVSHATDLKFQLGDLARSVVATPVDSLLTNTNILWADWLDQVIQRKDEKADDALLFANFIKQHPAADHLGGVARGGTLVLLYSADGTVVADVALPYWWPEVAEAAPDEPELPRPEIKPPISVRPPIRFFPPIDDVIKRRIIPELDDFRIKQFEPLRNETTTFQRNYLQGIRDTSELIRKSGATIGGIGTLPGTRPLAPSVTDPALKFHIEKMEAESDNVILLRQKILETDATDPSRVFLEKNLEESQGKLAVATNETANYVATADIDARTDGTAAAAATSHALSTLDAHKATTVAGGIKTTMGSAQGIKPEVKLKYGTMLHTQGFK